MRALALCWFGVVGLVACGGGDGGDAAPSTARGGAAGASGAKAGGGASAGGGTAGASGEAGASGKAGGAGVSGGGSAGASGKAGGAGVSGGGSAGASGKAGGAGGSGSAGASGKAGGAGGGGSAGASGKAGGAGGGGSAGASGGSAGASGGSAGAGGDAGGAGGASGSCSPACTSGTVCDTVTATCVSEPEPPFLTFPISGDRVAGLPELRWVASPGAATADARVELCDDEACAVVRETLVGAGVASPSVSLPRGAVFARAFGRTPRGDGTFIEGAKPSPLRVFTSSGRPAVSRGHVGIVPDLDRDGLAELGVGSVTANTSQISVTLSGSSKTTRVDGPDETPSGFSYGGFARFMVMASDVDGDGYPEIATVDREEAFPEPITIVRLELDPSTKKLVERQRLDVALPQYQRLRQLAPLGDVDGDGFADLAVVSALPAVPESGPGGGTVWRQVGVEILTLFGGPSGWSRTAKAQIIVPDAERTFENTPLPVRGVGDVDGDGVPDLVVGIQTTNPDSCRPMRRGRVELRKGSAGATFEVVLATVTDWFDPAPLGDVDGDGLADVGVSREPHETREPIPPSPGCSGSYTRTGFVAGEARVLRGAATAPLPEGAFTMPVDVVAGCTNGFGYGPSFLVEGRLTGSGDLDGDGLDDVAMVSPESHPGGASGCSSAGPHVRVLPGSSSATLSVSQVLAAPEASLGPSQDRVRIIGDLDASGRSALFVVGAQKGVAYAGPLGGLAAARQLTLTSYGRTPLGGL